VGVGASGQVDSRVPSDYPLSRNSTRHVCVFLLNRENPLYVKESKVRQKDKPCSPWVPLMRVLEHVVKQA